MRSERDIERALRLLDEVKGWHEFEEGLIDPVDWERFDSDDLLRVADGDTTIFKLVWGQDEPRDDARRLAVWEANAKAGRA